VLDVGEVECAATLDPRVKPEDDGRKLNDATNKKARRIAPAGLDVIPS